VISPLAAALIEHHPAMAAGVLERARPEAAAELLAAAGLAAAGRLLAAMHPMAGANALAALAASTPDTAAKLLAGLGTDEAATVLRSMPAETSAALVKKLPANTAVPLRLVLRFPSGSVGSLIDPRVVTVRPDTLIGEAAEIARHAPESLRKYIYVLDDDRRLSGVMDSRDCVLRDPERRVRAFALPRPAALRARMSLREAEGNPGWERLALLPVTDGGGRFLGVLRRWRLQQALADSTGAGEDGGLAGLALELADLYWRAAAGLLATTLGEERRP